MVDEIIKPKLWILKTVTVSTNDSEWLDKQPRGLFTKLVRDAIKAKRTADGTAVESPPISPTIEDRTDLMKAQ